ncbi:MAG: cation:proton antiporter [Oscillospiraceae bacterium]|nr:cation:proton antiporter [Oscillospiraceae bacterium]
MLTSLAFIFISGSILGAVFEKLRLPKIIGMLFAGVLIGPYALNIIDSTTLAISGDLRKMALVIIIIKAGLSLNINDFKIMGRPALMMSFLPAVSETLAYTLLAPFILGTSLLDSAIIGAVLSAVSPAVVVPRMVSLIDEGIGTDKKIPQMILAGASMDDVFVIILFSTFVNIASGSAKGFGQMINVPVSIISGIIVGALTGISVVAFFEYFFKRSKHIRNSSKVIILMSISFMMLTTEERLKNILPFSGLLAIMSMSMVIAMKANSSVVIRLKAKFGKLWLAAEIILFVLVGAEVNIEYTLKSGFNIIAMIFLALFIRSIGVIICMVGTHLNFKERVFCVFAYLPKATVQAAIGSIPLSMGLACGDIVLSSAVTGILLTAPLGAFLIDNFKNRLLK